MQQVTSAISGIFFKEHTYNLLKSFA